MDIAIRAIAVALFLQTVDCQFDLLGGLFGGGGNGFMDPFRGAGGRGNFRRNLGFGGGLAMPAPVDPAIQRQSRLTAAEENLAELLTESGANDPARLRVERMLRSGGGRLSGAAEPLNYLVQEYYMTTPGPMPPPNRAPVQTGPRGVQRGAGTGPSQYPNAMPSGQPTNLGQGWQTGTRNTGGRRQMRGRPSRGRGRNQRPIPTTTALPEWQQWLFGSQSQAPQKINSSPNNNVGSHFSRSQRGGQAQFSQGRQSQTRPSGRQIRPRSQNRNAQVHQPPPPNRPVRPPQIQPLPPQRPNNNVPDMMQNGPPTFGSFPSPQAGSPPQKSQTQTSTSQRTSIAVERLKNIQQRIDNLLKSQGGAITPSTNQQLTALQEIRDILSGKKIKNAGAVVKSGPSTSTRAGSPPANPAYETKFGPPPPPNEQAYPQLAPQYDPSLNHQSNNLPGNGQNAALSQTNAMKPTGAIAGSGVAAGPNTAKVQPAPNGPKPNQSAGKAATTVPPKLGDVRYIGQDKYVYTDADGFDTFQWIKATPGPPAEGQNQAQQQQGQAQQQHGTHANPPPA